MHIIRIECQEDQSSNKFNPGANFRPFTKTIYADSYHIFVFLNIRYFEFPILPSIRNLHIHFCTRELFEIA